MAAASLGRRRRGTAWEVGVAQGLAGAGEQMAYVPAQLAARARPLTSGHARKTEALRTASVAAVAVHHPRLRQHLLRPG